MKLDLSSKIMAGVINIGFEKLLKKSIATEIENTKKFIAYVNNDVEEIMDSFANENRRIRKLIKNDKLVKDSLSIKASAEKILEALKSIEQALSGKSYLKSDFEYAYFIKFLNNNAEGIKGNYKMLFDRFKSLEYENSMAVEYTRPVVTKIVNNSKKNGYHNEFTDSFDKKGNVILDQAFILNYKMKDYFEILNSDKYYDGRLDFKEFCTLIIDDELLKKARIESKKKNEAKEQERKLEREKKKAKESVRKVIYIEDLPQVNQYKKNKETRKDFDRRYFSSRNNELRKDITEVITLQNFINYIRSNTSINKKQGNEYIAEYKRILFEIRLNNLLPNMNEDMYKKISNILLLRNSNDKKLLDDLTKIILDDKYEEYVVEEILLQINHLLTEYQEEIKSNKMNFILFPDEEFLIDELNNLDNTNDKNIATKGIYQHLKMLEITDSNELKRNINDAFHHVNAFNIENISDNKIKPYRFGAKKSKILLYKLSINENNKKILQSIYNTDYDFDIYVVYGLGNVMHEDENDLYNRCNKYLENNINEFIRIYDIFSKPFTKETEDEAIDYINKSSNLLYELEESIKSNNNLSLTKKIHD